MKKNHVREKLAAGGTSIGCFLGLGSPTVAELLANVGFDWMMIETEHNAVGWKEIQHMLMAIHATKAIPLVRVPSIDPFFIQRSLDVGAQGIMVPMIRTEEDAKLVVAATRYPPHGQRGYGGLRASNYTLDSADYFRRSNEETLVVLNIETKEAIENIDAIAAVPGVDALMIGPFDLYLSLGLDPMRQPQPQGEEAMRRVLEAGRKYNRAVGSVYGTADDLRKRKEQGFRVLAFTDYLLLVNSARNSLAHVQSPPSSDLPK